MMLDCGVVSGGRHDRRVITRVISREDGFKFHGKRSESDEAGSAHAVSLAQNLTECLRQVKVTWKKARLMQQALEVSIEVHDEPESVVHILRIQIT